MHIVRAVFNFPFTLCVLITHLTISPTLPTIFFSSKTVGMSFVVPSLVDSRMITVSSNPAQSVLPDEAVGMAPSSSINDDVIEDNDEDQLIHASSIKYRNDTEEGDQMTIILNASSGQCKDKYRTQLWGLFFSYMCCVVATNIVTKEPLGKESDLYKKAYAMFVAIDNDGYVAIIKSGHGLFAGITDPKVPEYVVTETKKFIASTVKVKSKNAAEVCQMTEKGKVIWSKYKRIKTWVVNVANLLCRDVKSGENKTGVLLEIREKLWIMDCCRKRKQRLSDEALKVIGKGKYLFLYN